MKAGLSLGYCVVSCPLLIIGSEAVSSSYRTSSFAVAFSFGDFPLLPYNNQHSNEITFLVPFDPFGAGDVVTVGGCVAGLTWKGYITNYDQTLASTSCFFFSSHTATQADALKRGCSGL